jgi:hypothetical protein
LQQEVDPGVLQRLKGFVMEGREEDLFSLASREGVFQKSPLGHDLVRLLFRQ